MTVALELDNHRKFRLEDSIGGIDGNVGVGCISREHYGIVWRRAQGNLGIWNLAGGELLGELRPTSEKDVISVELFTADNNRSMAASLAADGTVNVWDLESQILTANFTVKHQWGVRAFAICEAQFGKLVMLTIGHEVDQKVRLWDLFTGRCLGVFLSDSPVTACRATFDRRAALLGHSSGELYYLVLTDGS